MAPTDKEENITVYKTNDAGLWSESIGPFRRAQESNRCVLNLSNAFGSVNVIIDLRMPREAKFIRNKPPLLPGV
jgi:hypothetical protein